MRKIRTGIFETNSSSVHCICIANSGENDFTKNVLRCKTDEFGWEYGMYSDVYGKADYLLTKRFSAAPCFYPPAGSSLPKPPKKASTL